jgi:RNA polymerase sigma-70 factor (ECF subfamily)
MAEPDSVPLDGAELLVRLSWVRSLARELVRDVHLAEDVAQDAALAALEGGATGRLARVEPRACGAWLRSVVRRIAALRFREHARRARREELVAAREEQPATVDVVAQLALHRRVVDAVESLEEPYRAAVLMRFYDGLPPRAIAERLGVPSKTVETRVARGVERVRARLVAQLGGEGDEARRRLARALAPLLLPGAMWMSAKTKLAVAAGVLLLLAGSGWSLLKFRASLDARPSSPAVAAPAAALDRGGPGARAVESATREAARIEEPAAPAPPPAAAPARPATAELRVRVLASDHAPIAGASVELVRREGLALPSLDFDDYAHEEVVDRGATDASGEAVFTVARGVALDVNARAGERLARTERDRYGGETVVVTPEPVATVRGRVTTKDGAPVADARLFLACSVMFVPRQAFTSDARGEYVATDVAPGTWWLSAQSSQGNRSAGVELALAAGETKEQDLIVGEGALLRGRVVDAVTQAPIAGAELAYGLDRPAIVRTDANGEYRWPGFATAGFQPLCVRARGYGRAEKWLRNVASGESVQDFALARGRTARGRVVDAAKRPLAGVYVAAPGAATAAGGQKLDVGSTRTRADGTFELADLRADVAHALVLRCGGCATRAYAFPEDEAQHDVLDLGEFELGAAAAIDGRVTDGGGAPLASSDAAGVQVELHGLNDDWDRLRRSRDGELPMTLLVYASRRLAKTDSTGAFHFVDLPAGHYEVVATRADETRKDTAELDLAAGERREGVELVLAGGLTIEGRVVDAEGAAVPNVFVRAIPEPPLTASDAGHGFREGKFQLAGLKPGEYTLAITPYGVEKADPSLPVHLPARREHVAAGSTAVVVELATGARLAGRVTESGGAPVALAQITMRGPGVAVARTNTSDDGRFVLVVPPDTSVTLEVRRPVADANGRGSEAPEDAPIAAKLDEVVAEDGEVEIVLPPRP